MANINKNIIMQAGAAVANATNKAAGLSAATPEPGSIISAIQLVNGGRTIGPDALAHFTESVRNKLLSLLVRMEHIQSGEGDPSPDNVRPISGRTGLSVYVSPTQDQQDATTYAVDWTTPAGTVYGGTVDVVTGVLTVDWAIVDLGTLAWGYRSSGSSVAPYFYADYGGNIAYPGALFTYPIDAVCSQYKVVVRSGATFVDYTLCGDGGVSVDQIQVKDPRYTDAATFKTAMSGVQLCYELATPLTYQLSTQDVVTLVGDNYIWSDSGDVTITE